MKKELRVLFFFALLLVLVACGDREIPTFDDILDQTVEVGSEPINWETLIENLSDNESSVDALEIQVDDNVNYDVPGTYTVTITVTDENDNKAAFTFNVTVEDNVKPVVTLNGSASITVTEGETFTDPGATYTDNVDGTGAATVSGTVDISTPGSYTLTYSYTDEAGNQAESVTRTVVVEPRDTVAPVVTLVGEATITIQLGETFTDPGATYSDNLDGTGNATASGTVDVNTVGSYTITYTATDSSGNTGTVTRTVIVSDTPPRLAQYAPEDDSTFGISRYFKFGNIEAFLLKYDAKNLLVIFEGQEVLSEIEFGKEPTGPDSPMPTEPFFQNLFAISENGLLIQTFDFMDGSQNAIVFNLNTKQVDESLPAGFVNWYATGPNQGPTSYLTEFDGYFYIVESGDDRGLYTFNDDLTLTRHVIFQRDFDNVYFMYKDEAYTIIETSSYGESYYQGTILLETGTNEILQTFNNSVRRNLLGEKLVLSYYDNSLTDNRQVIQVWSSPTEMEVLYVDGLYFFYEETNDEYFSIRKTTSLAVTFYDSVNQERQIRIYDETFTRLVTHLYGQYSWSVDQVGDYIVVLDRDDASSTYKIRAFKNDGSPEIVIDDFGMTTTYQSVSTIYLSTYQGGVDNQPFRYLYTVQGWNDDVDNSTYKAFYFEDGTINIIDLPGPITNYGANYFIDDYSKMVLSSYESEWDNMNSTHGNSLLTAHVYDFETETLTTSPTLDLGLYVGNSNRNFAYTDGYVLISIGEEDSYSTMKHFVLFDINAGTLQMQSLDTAINQSWINNFSVDGDVVTISFNSTSLISSVSDFSTFTEGEPTYGGGGGVYDIQDIINTDDLLLEMTFGEMGPTLVITLNGTELLSVSVANTSYQVYVYDAEGTENDTIFIGFRQDGYVIDLSDPEFTEYYGVVTSSGFLTLDANYNESFDVLPLDSSMFFDHYQYYVGN